MASLALDTYNYYILAGGVITLIAALIPNIFHSKHITPPVFYLLIGALIYFIGWDYDDFDFLKHQEIIKRLAEFVVIVALVNAGLKINKPLSWQTWKYSLLLIGITMPITIVSTALTGFWLLHFLPATAVLFGAVIAPTDPVLASDLQTSQPSKKDLSKIRLSLTSEAGVNDGLAFPFTFFAIFMAANGPGNFSWIGEWFYMEVLYKIVAGIVIGFLIGWSLHKLVFKLTSKTHHSNISRGILSLSLTLLPYAITEIAHGYGFIAVFIAACTFSKKDSEAKHMDNLHDFTEEVERIFVTFLFIFIGLYVSANFGALMDPYIIATSLIVIFVIRPLGGYVGLARTDLKPFEKFVLSFYGIRGIGSIYYLAYALSEAHFEGAAKLIQVTMVVIVFSVLIHGLSSTIVQKKLDKIDDLRQKNS